MKNSGQASSNLKVPDNLQVMVCQGNDQAPHSWLDRSKAGPAL